MSRLFLLLRTSTRGFKDTRIYCRFNGFFNALGRRTDSAATIDIYHQLWRLGDIIKKFYVAVHERYMAALITPRVNSAIPNSRVL